MTGFLPVDSLYLRENETAHSESEHGLKVTGRFRDLNVIGPKVGIDFATRALQGSGSNNDRTQLPLLSSAVGNTGVIFRNRVIERNGYYFRFLSEEKFASFSQRLRRV